MQLKMGLTLRMCPIHNHHSFQHNPLFQVKLLLKSLLVGQMQCLLTSQPVRVAHNQYSEHVSCLWVRTELGKLVSRKA